MDKSMTFPSSPQKLHIQQFLNFLSGEKYTKDYTNKDLSLQ